MGFFRKQFKAHTSKPALRQSAKGITLIEVAISMAIFGVLSVAVAGLISSGMDVQMSKRIQTYEHNMATNITDRLRMDLLMADNIAITGGGSILSFRTFNAVTATTENVTWEATGTSMTRTVAGTTNDYGQSPMSQIVLEVTCGTSGVAPCFQQGTLLGNQRVTMNDLLITHNTPANFGSRIDNVFGTALYRVNEYSFEVKPGETFQ